MLFEVTIRLVLCIALVDARVLSRSGKPDRRSLLTDDSISIGSEEAEYFVRHGSHGRTVALKKIQEPSPGKVVKRMNPKGDHNTEQMEISRSWSKLLDKLSDVRHVKSSEEEDQALSLLNVRMEESAENSIEYKDEPETGNDDPSDHMAIAQKWFPLLLRRAIDSMMQNISKHDVNHLVEQLTVGVWSMEDVDESEKRFVTQTLSDSIHASATNKVTEQQSWAEEPLKLKRSNCHTCGMKQEPNGAPCVVNIFNNSHIGYLILKPANNLSGDNPSSLLEKPALMGHFPQSLNLSFIFPSSNLPILSFLNCDTASSTTLVNEECTTSIATTTTTTTTDKPTTSQQTTPAPHTCPTISHCQPIYCPHFLNHPLSGHQVRSVMYPWLKHNKEDLKQPYHLASEEYDDKVLYDRFKNFRYGIAGPEIGDCSSAEDDTVSTVVKRAPQVRDDRKLKNTLAKFELSLDRDRSAGSKSSGSHLSSRQKTKSDTPRGERVQQKSKNYESVAKTLKRSMKTATEPDFYRL